jgi:hypothetical protein
MEATLPLIFMVQRAEHGRPAQSAEVLEIADKTECLLLVSGILAGAPLARAVWRLADELVHVVVDVRRRPLQLGNKAEQGRNEDIPGLSAEEEATGAPALEGNPVSSLAKDLVPGLVAFAGADEVAEVLARGSALHVCKFKGSQTAKGPAHSPHLGEKGDEEACADIEPENRNQAQLPQHLVDLGRLLPYALEYHCGAVGIHADECVQGCPMEMADQPAHRSHEQQR